MADDVFHAQSEDWKRRIEFLNAKLHPIVHGSSPQGTTWEEFLRRINEFGHGEEIETVFDEIIDRFESLNGDQRQMIIDLIRTNQSVMYGVVPRVDMDTQEGFRKRLMLFIIEDQGADPRDALVQLREYRKQGEKLGFDVNSILEEVAHLASDRDRYGWGSTRKLILGE
jgi:hypothetical protein